MRPIFLCCVFPAHAVMVRMALTTPVSQLPTKEVQVSQLTATLLRRQSPQAPTLRINAALSRCTADSGPVRRLLGRRCVTTSAPSLTENTPCVAVVYAVAVESLDAKVASVAAETVVEVDDVVSFLTGDGLPSASGV